MPLSGYFTTSCLNPWPTGPLRHPQKPNNVETHKQRTGEVQHPNQSTHEGWARADAGHPPMRAGARGRPLPSSFRTAPCMSINYKTSRKTGVYGGADVAMNAACGRAATHASHCSLQTCAYSTQPLYVCDHCDCHGSIRLHLSSLWPYPALSSPYGPTPYKSQNGRGGN